MSEPKKPMPQIPEAKKDIKNTDQKVKKNPSENHKKTNSLKKKHKKTNKRLILVMLCAMTATTAAMIFNMVRVVRTSSSTSAGKEEAMSGDTNRSMKNDQYEIGNNPTKIEEQYFQELTDAVNAGDDEAIISGVVKSFISDYFTMTNKDGNYEIGGQQYIYADKYKAFETWARYHYYADLDLYIHQYGRDKLLEVKEITIDQGPEAEDDLELAAWDTPMTFDTYHVHAIWTYQPGTSLDVSKYPQGAWFDVVDHDGRWEIAAYYTDNAADENAQASPDASASAEAESAEEEQG